MARAFSFVTAIIATLHVVVAYPDGAPTSACSSFEPNHGVTLPQSSPSPYELDLSQFAVASSFVYIPGQQYNITLKSSSGTVPFKGFLIQAHSVYNTNSIRGSFSNLPNDTQYVTCSFSYPMATVTHDNTDRNDYYSLTLTWMAPAANNGPLIFRFTVVQTYSIFWSEITSEIVQEYTNGYLLLANVETIKTMNLDGSSLQTLTYEPRNVVDTDFHYRENFLFWADFKFPVYMSEIKRSSLNGGNIVTIAQNNLITPGSVAVDWINDKLYWCDENTSRIEVSELSGSNRKVLLDTDILYPRDLVIDPITRYIYWVDYGLNKIERASLDGTSRQIIHSTNIIGPVALTIDYETQILYWIDSTIEKLESSSVSGSNRQVLLTTQSILNNAGEMTLLSNTLYWAERVEDSVYSTDINDPANYQVLHSGLTYEPYSVQAVHPLRQPQAPNFCEINNGGCQQLCLLSANSDGYSCSCADGFLPTNDDNSQCAAASTYSVTFCLSGIGYCTSWANDQYQDAKMLKIAQAMVAGVRSICTECTDTFTSGNLLSTEYSNFTCQSHNSSLVQFRGFIYGYSLTDDAPLLSAINQWITMKPFINVFGYQLQVEINCNDDANSAGLSSGAIGGIVTATLFAGALCLCCCCCYIFLNNSSKDEYSPSPPVPRTPRTTTVAVPSRNTNSEQMLTGLRGSSQTQLIALKEIEFHEGPGGTKIAVQTDTVIDPVSRIAVQAKTGVTEVGGERIALGQVRGIKF